MYTREKKVETKLLKTRQETELAVDLAKGDLNNFISYLFRQGYDNVQINFDRGNTGFVWLQEYMDTGMVHVHTVTFSNGEIIAVDSQVQDAVA